MFLPLDLMGDDNKRIVLMLRYCEARLSYLHGTVGVVFRRRKMLGHFTLMRRPNRFHGRWKCFPKPNSRWTALVSFTQFAAELSDLGSLAASLQRGFFLRPTI
jgi:hypothetical protein